MAIPPAPLSGRTMTAGDAGGEHRPENEHRDENAHRAAAAEAEPMSVPLARHPGRTARASVILAPFLSHFFHT